MMTIKESESRPVKWEDAILARDLDTTLEPWNRLDI